MTLKAFTLIDADTYYLPEEHSTHLPFSIQPHLHPKHAVVITKTGLTQYQEQKSISTINLLDLANIDNRDILVDIRSKKRKGAIIAVAASKELFDQTKFSLTFDINIAAGRIAVLAKEIGFFSLWHDVFANEPKVMRALIDPI